MDKLLLMRLFPVGRGGQLAHDILDADQYRAAISCLRRLERKYGRPALSLQCALRHLETRGSAPGHGEGSNPCDLVTESFGLAPDGRLLSSPWAINGKGQPMHEFFVLGNLANTPLSDILASRRVIDIRSRADDNFGHCKIFAFLNSNKPNPIDRLTDATDPLYS
ncbi:MAG: SPASM domain-containing protein [Rhodoplanes sp.]